MPETIWSGAEADHVGSAAIKSSAHLPPNDGLAILRCLWIRSPVLSSRPGPPGCEAALVCGLSCLLP